MGNHLNPASFRFAFTCYYIECYYYYYYYYDLECLFKVIQCYSTSSQIGNKENAMYIQCIDSVRNGDSWVILVAYCA